MIYFTCNLEDTVQEITRIMARMKMQPLLAPAYERFVCAISHRDDVPNAVKRHAHTLVHAYRGRRKMLKAFKRMWRHASRECAPALAEVRKLVFEEQPAELRRLEAIYFNER